ncbi:MAG: ACT domain-containing protein [Lachnospiraceae bacterium]|nr:ACT domain-containing protein [Lachnospiraceae bacterium]MBQ5699018.1 ACT domain-containing protein [Lachnospiraceae bacterium]MBQ5806131.1 ACT domain-containing protein [Lachnospiraceae bacterium]
MDKVIISVVGKDTVGIIAAICTYLAKHNGNILDISQTIVKEYFNMLMIIDGSKMDVSFGEMVESLDKIGEELGMSIKCQREEIFTKMHRI